MCKSTHPQQSGEPGAAAAAAAGDTPRRPQPEQQSVDTADYTVKSFELKLDQQQEGQHEEILSSDESSGVVVFGCFAAGALVGIVICAPAFVVLLFGAGAAALTKSDSKAGKISRKVGKVSSDIILAGVRIAREFNLKHRLADKTKETAQRVASRVSTEVKKRGIVDDVKARTKSLWAHIQERTTPAGEAPSQAQAPPSAGLVNDGTQLPFGGTADAYETTPSSSEWKSLPPKTFDA
ncbi:unnamed protein product [Pylaiella littoralis]